MYSTYQMLLKTRIEAYKSLDYVELSKMYKMNEDSCIISEVFCREFPLFLKLTERKMVIYNDDIPGCVLMCIDVALKTYESNRNVKFVTYLYLVVKNKMYILQDSSFRHKNSPQMNTVDLSKISRDNENDCWALSSIGSIQEAEYNLMVEDLLSMELTEAERYVLRGLLSGKSVVEISQERGTTRAYVDFLRGKLKSRVKNYLSPNSITVKSAASAH